MVIDSFMLDINHNRVIFLLVEASSDLNARQVLVKIIKQKQTQQHSHRTQMEQMENNKKSLM